MIKWWSMKYKRIKELRELNEYSKAKVAKLVGVSQKTYNYYENGDSELPADILIKLSKLYNVSCSYLLELSESYK